MNAENFKNTTAGRVLRQPTGYLAFIPAKLPPSIFFDDALALNLSRADAALGELAGLGILLPNPHVLIGPLIRREAVLSSRIEGTQASLTDVFMDESVPSVKLGNGNAADLKEVRNYVAALEYGITRLNELPLSLRLVRELHERLLAGVRGHHATPGEFRKSQNWIGPAGSNLMTAPYVPPPPEEMMELLFDWERYLHVRDHLPDLIQCAILHEQFEAIHPFLDGNGRVGRLLVTLFLIERKRLSQPLLYLSDYIERHRSDYYDLLQRVRTHGEWLPWIRYFLAGVETTAKDAAACARRLLGLCEHFMRETKGATALVDQILTNPCISIAKVSEVMKVSAPTATKMVRQLEAGGLLKETTGRSWGKVYVATEVLAVIERAAAE
jgi:Fic family protein